ncbi:MAG: hypothetical protein ACT4P4_22585 [Betaproteobacteria bacterium]
MGVMLGSDCLDHFGFADFDRRASSFTEDRMSNPFAFNLEVETVSTRQKRSKRSSKSSRREVWVTVAGKRMKTTARGARILHNIRGAKGLDVPPAD